MRKIKVVLFTLCVLVLSLAGESSVFAYNFPASFWSINAEYENAVSRKDHNGIISYGNQVINLMQSEPDCTEKQNVLISRYEKVGDSYASIGDYDNAAVHLSQCMIM